MLNNLILKKKFVIIVLNNKLEKHEIKVRNENNILTKILLKLKSKIYIKEKFMAIEKVREYFKQFGCENKILEFDVSSATVPLAAKALNTEEARIAKSISFYKEDYVILIVTAGDMKIDNQKYKAKFGLKAKMLAFEDAERLIGHAVGGVCPFAVNEKVKVYLDNSLKRFSTVFPACGSSNSAIELDTKELEKLSKFIEWVDVCKPIE